jgi:cytochrome c biogenesis protein
LEEKGKQDIFEKIWNFFASVKFTIFILITLVLTSIVGTIVEQRAEPAQNIKLLAKFFGDSTAPAVYNIFAQFGFMDMYHSWWFITILSLFCINLIVCTVERFPKTLRLVKAQQRPLRENAIKSLPIKKEMTFKTTIDKAKEAVFNSLSASKYRVFEAQDENAVQLYSQKGRYTRFGLYVVHVSIILIFIGAIIGAKFGFSGFLNIPEGSSYPFALSNTGPLTKEARRERNTIINALETTHDISLVSQNLGMPLDILKTRMKKYGIVPLGFSVKCNWYNTDYYGDSDTPLEFQSELVIIKDGKEVMQKVIEVNHPLTYRGIKFFQSSYGMVPNAVGIFVLKVSTKDGSEETFRLRFGESFTVPGTNIRGTILNFSPALTRDRETGVLTTYKETMVNPAVAIEFDFPDMQRFTGWILKRYPETGILPDGSQVKFEDYWGVEYTGLQVSKDPGVGLIYIACIVMTIGLYVAFFMSHKKIWIRLSPETVKKKNSVKIALGGSASKNRLAFEREIEKIVAKISQNIDGGNIS